MNIANLVRRIISYVVGFFVIAIGINVSKCAALGISAVSATPYALERAQGVFGLELHLSYYIYFVFALLILLQIVILRRKYAPVQLLQFATSFLLAFFVYWTDRGHLLSFLPEPGSYLMMIVYTLVSAVLIGAGVSLYILPRLIPMPAEGLSLAWSDATNGRLKFHDAKNIVDISLLSIAVVISLSAPPHKLAAVREGTVLIALLVGRFVGMFNRLWGARLTAWFGK